MSFVTKKKAYIGGAVLLVFAALAVSVMSWRSENNKPVVTTSTLSQVSNDGKILEGKSIATKQDQIQAAPKEKLIFESQEIKTNSKTANAAVLSWDQQESEAGHTHGASVEFRTNNGKEWSDWVQASTDDHQKDGTEANHNALVLADKIVTVQYRFVLQGEENEASPLITLSDNSIEMIDASKGPTLKDAQKKSVATKIGDFFTKKAEAKADSPYIYNRAQWGSPEAYSSPEWDPEYVPLHRVVVHHTAATFNGDSFASMRAIWHLHKNINGWGDIGYNYVVDPWGNMLQGRYYDYNEAARQKGEVVGAHAYQNNRGTVGISVMGDFTNREPPNEVFYSVARLAAYKSAAYDFNPAYDSWFGPQLIGHRDVNQTACPGQRFYNRLQELKNLVNAYYPSYNSMEHLDHTYVGQGSGSSETSRILLWPGTSTNAYIDVRNNGNETWNNNGFGMTMLGTDDPRDRRSPLCHASWLGSGCDRPASFANKVIVNPDNSRTLQPSSTIAPGEIGRFSFNVTAPMSGGVYKEQFNLLSAQRSWFLNNKNIYFEFIVPPPTYAWQWQTQGIYTDSAATTPANLNSLRHKDKVYFSLTAKNTGNQPWVNNGPNPVRLATNKPQDRYSWLCESTWVNNKDCNRAATLKESRVEPGQNGTFGFWVEIPYGGTSAKTMREHFNLTAESKQWMNDVGAYWEFTVQP